MAGRKNTDKANTLKGFWNRLNQLAPSYLEALPSVNKELLDKINSMLKEVNSSPLPKLIADNFIKPFFENEGITIFFSGDENGTFGNWVTRLIKEKNFLKIDPVGLHIFSRRLEETETKLSEIPDTTDFVKYRSFSLNKEIKKLPEEYLIFIAVLKEVAEVKQIAAVERGKDIPSDVEEDANSYLYILWALKQFEEFYRKVQNRNLRSEYGIVWHEGEWVEDMRER